MSAGASERTRVVRLASPHWFAYAWLLLMGGVVLVMWASGAAPSALALPVAVLVVPPALLVSYRTYAVLDAEERTITLYARSLVITWRRRVHHLEGRVRLVERSVYSRHRDDARVGEIRIDGEPLVALEPERARQAAHEIADFFGVPLEE